MKSNCTKYSASAVTKSLTQKQQKPDVTKRNEVESNSPPPFPTALFTKQTNNTHENIKQIQTYFQHHGICYNDNLENLVIPQTFSQLHPPPTSSGCLNCDFNSRVSGMTPAKNSFYHCEASEIVADFYENNKNSNILANVSKSDENRTVTINTHTHPTNALVNNCSYRYGFLLECNDHHYESCINIGNSTISTG